MSDERQDDEILGRALSRAIETQDAEETPYERSRLAVRPLRRGVVLWQLIGAGAVTIVLALAFGAWFTRPVDTLPVAGSPTPMSSVSATNTPAATAVASATTAPTSPVWVYFTRDGLPPIGANVSARVPDALPDHRILARLEALHDLKPADMPQGASDPFALIGRSGNGSSYGVGVKIDGDLATVGFDLPNGWGVHGAAQAQQLVQQIVYTATEETGIRRVLVVENGKTTATIDQLVVNRPLTRDDVSGYAAIAQTGTTEFEGSTKLPNVTGDVVSREIVDGTLVRYTFVGSDRAHNATKTDLPPFAISFQRNDGSVPHNTGDGAPPAYLLTIAFHVNATGEFGAVGHVERVDRSPLRLVTSSDAFVQLGLDDARPWRAYEPDPQHLIVEIGGDPRTVSDRIAVASPAPASAAQRSFTLSGLARTFEANVVWRVKDASGKIVANGHTTASIGTSVFWGTFSAPVTLPSSVSGNVTLEVYEVSPKDGTEQGVVSVPLVIR